MFLETSAVPFAVVAGTLVAAYLYLRSAIETQVPDLVPTINKIIETLALSAAGALTLVLVGRVDTDLATAAGIAAALFLLKGVMPSDSGSATVPSN